MYRVIEEQKYWDKAALDPQVDKKFISDINFHLPLKPKGKVLEIGCGVGRLMEDGYYGIDISEGMLKIAKERKPNCFFELCDGRSIPFKDNTFDFVYSVLLFQHIPLEGVITYIIETSRVIKKHGVFLFQFIEGDEEEPFSYHHTFDAMRQTLGMEGFEISECKNYFHPLWTWITAKKL